MTPLVAVSTLRGVRVSASNASMPPLSERPPSVVSGATKGFLEQHGQRGQLAEVVLQLTQAGPIANSDVRAATSLDRAETLSLLDRLVKAGRLTRSGRRRGVAGASSRYLSKHSIHLVLAERPRADATVAQILSSIVCVDVLGMAGHPIRGMERNP